jgi:general L-amino acid transport system permease protein
MNNFNILKPNKENLNLFMLLGFFFITLSFIDILSSTFFNFNITGFFPSIISYF